MNRFAKRHLIPILVLCLAAIFAISAFAEEDVGARRPLRVALYPYVPQAAELCWKLETDFESANPDIDLQFVDLSADYYSGGLLTAFKENRADVIEVDAVFMADLKNQQLLKTIPLQVFGNENSYFRFTVDVVKYYGEYFGVPHWICGNFVLFQANDPDALKFKGAQNLNDLIAILNGTPPPLLALLTDLKGSLTLGEIYLGSLLGTYKNPETVIDRVFQPDLDASAVDAVKSILRDLCGTGHCRSDKHHNFGQYYQKQLSHRRVRALIGFSENMNSVVDEYLHGVDDNEPAVGEITFQWDSVAKKYIAVGKKDVDAVGALFSKDGFKMLGFVDFLGLPACLSGQTLVDAYTFIKFYNTEAYTLQLLLPEYGSAPRYLMPALINLYSNDQLLKAAPLYSTLKFIMDDAVTITAVGLNDRLRAIGKELDKILN